MYMRNGIESIYAGKEGMAEWNLEQPLHRRM